MEGRIEPHHRWRETKGHEEKAIGAQRDSGGGYYSEAVSHTSCLLTIGRLRGKPWSNKERSSKSRQIADYCDRLRSLGSRENLTGSK